MTDFLLLEKLHIMIKEIPKPRLMFRKGISAEGFFRPYMSFSEYTEADIFGSFDEITPVTVRFSSMLGDKGTADTVRNIKAMGVKFHSSGGDYDMICHSLPVFFINDKDKILSLIKALTRKEYFDGINRNEFWRFVVENPEAVNCAIRLFSHEGLSSSYVNMQWFSVNLALWENGKGEKFPVRYKWIPVFDESSGLPTEEKRLDRISAEFMAGFDSDRASNELENAINSGYFPCYELYIQMMEESSISKLDEQITSCTLTWDEEANPPVAAGVMKLTGIPEEYRARNDLLSFVPGNTVKGIDIYRDEFVELINYIYQTEAIERGEKSW